MNNKFTEKCNLFLQSKYPTIIWFALGLIAVLLELSRGSINNYLIYKGVFTNTIHQQNLYDLYPKLYSDSNHYGPLFSLVIAPFALLPNSIGVILWAIFNIWILFKAIKCLPLSITQQNSIFLISAIELMTSIHSVQVNPFITATIIFAYILIKSEKDFWACLFIALGFYVKLYGIVGLLFWVFSKHKLNFIAYFFFWMVIFFVLPMLISSPQFIIDSYLSWYKSLVEKNIQNTSIVLANMQDISVMGMIKRLFNYPNLSNISVILPCLVLYALPLLRFSQYKFIKYQLNALASTLLFIVLFSTSSESPTYIIAVIGASIWFVLQSSLSKMQAIILLFFLLVLTSLSSTDLVPHFFKKNVVYPFALKALPCFIIWLVLLFQMQTTNFTVSKQNDTIV